MENDRMFDRDSFTELSNPSEVKAAVSYFAHNEIKFRSELIAEGLSYEEVQDEVSTIWKSILEKCEKYKYSDYITEAKKKIFSKK